MKPSSQTLHRGFIEEAVVCLQSSMVFTFSLERLPCPSGP